MPSSTVDLALEYLRRGWSIIPVGGDKRPLLRRWATYQSRLPTESEVREWYTRWPNGGVAVVTGKVSGLVVLDVDPRHGGNESLQGLLDAGEITHADLEGPRVHTQDGGMHYYFAYPEGTAVKTKPKFRSGLDLKSDGGYVVAPPTMVPETGRGWTWVD